MYAEPGGYVLADRGDHVGFAIVDIRGAMRTTSR
jgi:hypothetical protein